MSNISEQYRKPLASDETGKAIADKLDGKIVEVETRNISEQYRQPLMTEETAREILEKIDGGGSGGGLPEVTEDDNGDVLTVVEGAWAKAEASGGGVEKFIITLNSDGESMPTSNKTFQEITSAFISGKQLFVDVSDIYGNGYDGGEIIALSGYGYTDGRYLGFRFTTIGQYQGEPTAYYIYLSEDLTSPDDVSVINNIWDLQWVQ